MYTSTATTYSPDVTSAPKLARIMVALDGSAFAELAIDAALAIAQRTGASIQLVRVHEPLLPGGLPPDAQWLAESIHESVSYLDARARDLREAGIDVGSTMLDGAPVEALCFEARRSHADLIVIATHGRTGMRRAILGSVADGVARHSEVPVLLVRPGDAIGPSSRAVSLDRILVALDGSVEAEASLPLVAILASAFGSMVQLLRVVRPETSPLLGTPMSPPVLAFDRELTARARADAEDYLLDVEDRLRAAGVARVALQTSLSGSVAREVVTEAGNWEADLVVLGFHARGASRLLFGSVTDAVLRHCGSSVLLVRDRASLAAESQHAGAGLDLRSW